MLKIECEVDASANEASIAQISLPNQCELTLSPLFDTFCRESNVGYGSCDSLTTA